jgi:hypothetical protein
MRHHLYVLNEQIEAKIVRFISYTPAKNIEHLRP